MKLIAIDDWRSFFPFDVVRPEQEKAINFILNAFVNEGKRFCLMEMATGTGKSATGITVARYLNAHKDISVSTRPSSLSSGAYVLTTQKVLQDQYVSDFGKGNRDLLRSIRSSSNYRCQYYPDQDCGESRRVLTKLAKQLVGTEFFSCCRNRCPYGIDKQAFIDSPIAITNFSYFLAETMYAGKLEPRSLLIIDECHCVEEQLSKFIEVTFSERFAHSVLKCKRMPALDTQEAVFAWIKQGYKVSLQKHLKGLEKVMEGKFDAAGLEGFGEFSKQYEMLDKHICKVNRFINSYDPENWIMNVVRPNAGGKRRERRFEFKPIDVSGYSEDSLFRFADRVLMMSATVVDKNVFSESIGINVSDVAFLRLPSPFPVENRPIHYLPVGSMSKQNIDATLPVMVEAIRMLLEQHKDEKGIIHTTNYRIATYLKEHIRSSRLIVHSSDNREASLKVHMEGNEPTVLVSPSMMEGVDLVDDASRFQVLCKVPFPYLGDAVIKKRMTKNKAWYSYQTAKLVIQAMGRSVRNDTDHAVSYILDTDWSRFYGRNRHLFSEDFVRSLA